MAARKLDECDEEEEGEATIERSFPVSCGSQPTFIVLISGSLVYPVSVLLTSTSIFWLHTLNSPTENGPWQRESLRAMHPRLSLFKRTFNARSPPYTHSH
jgi:hypothetical protein